MTILAFFLTAPLWVPGLILALLGEALLYAADWVARKMEAR